MTLQLRNDPPPHTPWRGEEPGKKQQKTLLAGLNCLSGQQDLFPTDGDAVGEDEAPDEVNLAERLIHHSPEHLRVPVVDRREDREHGATEHHVVEVRDDDVGVVDVDVRRCRGHPDAR